MAEDIEPKTLEILLKEEKEDDRKNICSYKTNSCLMTHPDQEKL
jgi:hypothetical protein